MPKPLNDFLENARHIESHPPDDLFQKIQRSVLQPSVSSSRDMGLRRFGQKLALTMAVAVVMFAVGFQPFDTWRTDLATGDYLNSLYFGEDMDSALYMADYL